MFDQLPLTHSSISFMSFKRELVRKAFHVPGVLFLFLGKDHRALSLIILGFLISAYTLSFLLEKYTQRGIPLISDLTHWLKRDQSFDPGPLCLGVGILIVLAFFDYTIAACAILQVCIADAVACLFGKYLGKRKIFYSSDKSYLGSFIFLIVAFLIQLPLVSPQTSLLLAIVGMLLESLPLGTLDNFLVAVGVAIFFQLALF